MYLIKLIIALEPIIERLAPVVEELIKAIEDAHAAGKATSEVHNTVLDHLAELPAKIRG